MSKKVTISVTESDCKKGEISESESCPVALALKRILGKKVRVCLGYEDEYYCDDSWINNEKEMKNKFIIKDGKSMIVIPMTKKVADKITDFDANGFMDPFEFDLEVPF